jgi:DNA-binding PadR family transcriptional regulator
MMEELDLVTSRWDAGSAGPPRRLYQLTPKGDRYLAGWVDDLRETDRVLHHFLETYDTHMERHQ